MSDALQSARAASAQEPEEELEQPASMSEDGSSLFLDKDMFPEGCKEGDVVMIRATVKSTGSKVEVTPEEITEAAPDAQGGQGAEEEGSQGVAGQGQPQEKF